MRLQNNRPYEITPQLEEEVVFLTLTSTVFWSAIGQHLIPERLRNPLDKLLVKATNGLGAQKNGQGASKSLYITNYIRGHLREWKITHEEFAEIEKRAADLISRYSFLEPDEADVIAVMQEQIKQQLLDSAQIALLEGGKNGGTTNACLKKAVDELNSAISLGNIANDSEFIFSDDDDDSELTVPDTARFGISELDEIAEPVERGNFGLVITSTGSGKTTFLTQLATSLMIQGYSGVYISYEDKAKSVLTKHKASLTDVLYSRLKNGEPDGIALASMRMKRIREHLPTIGKLAVQRTTRGVTTVRDMENKIALVEDKMERKIDFLMVDYLELVGDGDSKSPLFMRVRNVSDALVSLCDRKKIWCWSAQQARETERKGKQDKNSKITRIDLDCAHNGQAGVKAADAVISIEPAEDNSCIRLRTSKRRDGVARNCTNPIPTDFAFGRLVRSSFSYNVIFPEDTNGQTRIWQ